MLQILFYLISFFLIIMLSRFLSKRLRKWLPAPVLFVLIVILLAGFFIYMQHTFTFDDINQKNRQEGLQNVMSPDGMHAASVYYEMHGGAGGSVNVWVEVKNKKDGTTKVIYYAHAKQDVIINWLDGGTLAIRNKGKSVNSDRSMELNIKEEIYDESGMACKSLLMKDDYKKCYQAEY